MCNHNYSIDRVHYGYGPNGDKCPYTELYKTWAGDLKTKGKSAGCRFR